jgi:GNAT superfamily N-acetyltransferase
MTCRIRPFAPNDYPAICEVGNVAYSEYPSTVEELRYQDENRDPKCRLQRWVTERDGRVVGVGEYTQAPGTYHPQKFVINVMVHPNHQRNGLGSALYERVIEGLRPLDPISLRSNVREDMVRGVRFLKDRGFREAMRSWESRLDVAAFDTTPYAGLGEKVRAQGIEIKTLKEIQGDPDYARKIYELECELLKDVPHPDEQTTISYDTFIARSLKNPNLLPEAYFVAVKREEYVGTSALWTSQANDELYTGLTGVKRAYRHRGIALALKLRGIAYAKAHGRPIIKTWNASNNRAMLSINEALGYVKQPAWIDFTKIIKKEGQ